ncbi:MAG TPA: putative DNA binding domain-containing protein [Candidatus Ozemobacteraceae bacterium]|nr:putative DNA binding domain-containing protein [Candidatus Ozemobacteraceae bacterium]
MTDATPRAIARILDESDLRRRLSIGERFDFEVKAAQGGFPRSAWETYSAFANTDGGIIVLGVSEVGGQFRIDGLKNPQAIEKELWDGAHNSNTVSCNLLLHKDVAVVPVGDLQVLVISVPRAPRQKRPVFLGKNPFEGTFRRHSEGDHRADPGLIKRMIAEQGDDPVDSRILPGFTLKDIDTVSLHQYRQRLSSRTPAHPFLELDDLPFLEALGGWRRDRRSEEEGITAAGILMFGKWAAIRSNEAFPAYHVDYREKLSDDPNIRWDLRIIPDGTWPGNLFSFFFTTIQRLNANLSVPFQLDGELLRKGETVVHEAVREALVNALIHADYAGTGGVVIQHTRLGLEFANPGTFLVPLSLITTSGNISDCRNRSLQTMFQLIGGGEKAGSGMAKIFRGWASQQWRKPAIEELVEPARVYVRMPFVSLHPPEILEALKNRLKSAFASLSPFEIQALVTAQVEGCVTNVRLQEIVDDHPTDITRSLHALVTRGWLRQEGNKRGAKYFPLPSSSPGAAEPGTDGLTGQAHDDGPGRLNAGQTPQSDDSRTHTGEPCPHNGDSRPHNDDSRPHNGKIYQHSDTSAHFDEALLAIALPAVKRRRLSPVGLAQIIVRLCRARELRLDELAGLLRRNPAHIRDRYLKRLIECRIIHRRHPEHLNAPDQLYRCEQEPDVMELRKIFGDAKS